MNLPLDKDWDDLPEETRQLFTREQWQRIQRAIKTAVPAFHILKEASELMERNGGDDPVRWKEMQGTLDAIRQARNATEKLVYATLNDGTQFSEALERLADRMEDLKMEMFALQGQAATRILTQQARMLEHLSSQPRDSLSEEARDLVRQWQEGERERCLSQLPIEIRRRIEAGEPPEPGDVKPL